MTSRVLQSYVPEARPQINVTPLIDVMLALVMILMVTAPLALHRIPIPLAASSSGTEPAVLPLSIKNTGELYLAGVAVNRSQLESTLTAAALTDVPPLLEIRPDADAAYDDVAIALALAKRSGMQSIRIEGTRAD
jgi:biopolymer transport protein ExbD